MAKCSNCGKPLGFLSIGSACIDCQRLLEKQRLQEQTEIAKMQLVEKRKKEEDRERAKREQIGRLKDLISARIARGQRVFLYHSIYVPVDSSVNGESMSNGFHIEALKGMGLNGWEIVQVVPRTVATVLENRNIASGNVTFAGGLGGTVAGVHVMLKKEVASGWEKDEADAAEVSASIWNVGVEKLAA